MAKMKFILNKKAFAQLRTLPAVMEALDDKAAAIAGAAGPGYVTQPASATGGRVRGRAAVIAGTAEAIKDAATNGTLQKAMSAGVGDV